MTRSAIVAVSAFLAAISATPRPQKVTPAVAVITAPEGGIQPEAVAGADGDLHVVYFTGEASGGDLYYIRMRGAEHRTSQPVRLNSIAQSALATGSVRGAQLALGRNGRVHVAWHGSKP